MYFTVYDQNGEIFEVPAHKCKRLIVDLGWTFHPPQEEFEPFKRLELEKEFTE